MAIYKDILETHIKILAIGGSSLGRSRLRALTYLHQGDVFLFELAEERCRKTASAFGIRGYTNWEGALAQQPDTLTILPPPALHEPYVRCGKELNLRVFDGASCTG